MTRILVEDDAILRTVPVIIDPTAPADYEKAIVEFYRHDVPDFLGWRETLRGRIPGLFPATVIFAKDQADLREKIVDVDGVIVESLEVGEAELAVAPRLKSALRFGFLPTTIDVAACAKRGVVVDVQRRRVNVAVAEHAFTLMLALAKRLPETGGLAEAEKLRERGFDCTPYDRRYCGNSNFARVTGLKTMNGATLGLLGMGEIGREIAIRAAAFGMRVLYYQRNRIPAVDEWRMNATYAPLAEVMAQSDVFSVNVPLTAGTRGIIDATLLRQIKPGAILINVARAELVDRAALMEALELGRLGGFGLDVGYEEPAMPGEKLLTYPNVLITPHTAVADRENNLLDMEEMYTKIWRAITIR